MLADFEPMPGIQRKISLVAVFKIGERALGIALFQHLPKERRSDAPSLRMGANTDEMEIVMGFVRVFCLRQRNEIHEPANLCNPGDASQSLERL